MIVYNRNVVVDICFKNNKIDESNNWRGYDIIIMYSLDLNVL